jgi:hypothetical protein
MQCSVEGCRLAQWKDIRPWRPEFGREGKFLGVKKKSEAAMGGGARSAPVLHVKEPKKTGARSARTGGQDPLVCYSFLFFFSFVQSYVDVIVLKIYQCSCCDGIRQK